LLTCGHAGAGEADDAEDADGDWHGGNSAYRGGGRDKSSFNEGPPPPVGIR